MSRRLPVAAAALTLSTLAMALPAQASAARLTVTADEWRLVPSATTIRAGSTSLRYRNIGQYAHNLALRRLDSRGRLAGPTLRVATTRPGASRARTLSLRRGTWRMWCTIPNHRPLGMRRTLRVR